MLFRSGEVVADGVRVPPRGRAAEPSVALQCRSKASRGRFRRGERRRRTSMRVAGVPSSGPETPRTQVDRSEGNETKLRGGRSGEKRGFWPVRGVTLTTWWKSEIAVWLVALDWESGILG